MLPWLHSPRVRGSILGRRDFPHHLKHCTVLGDHLPIVDTRKLRVSRHELVVIGPFFGQLRSHLLPKGIQAVNSPSVYLTPHRRRSKTSR